MMRKFTIGLAMCSAFFLLSRCNGDEAVSPPKSSVTVDKTSGVVYDDVIKDEFTFTVTEVNAESIALLPYGLENQSWGAVTVSSFTGGKATVTFHYTHVGTFQVVVVSNNHSSDGKSVKNTYSDPITVTITSGHNQISDFSFAKVDKGQTASTKTVIDQDNNTIMVDVPYGNDVTKLVASFTADAFTKVTIGSSEQTSGSTANNFTSPVTYTVTSANGTTNSYVVTVNVTPINNTFTFKSFTGKAVNKDAKTLGGSLATTDSDIVFYDVKGTPADALDSVTFSYELNNPFGVVHNVISGVAETRKMKQATAVKIPGKVNVLGQDSVAHAYTIYAVEAPLLSVYGPGGSSDNSVRSVATNFTMLVKALKGTVTDSKISLQFQIKSADIPANVTINSIKLIDKDHPSPGLTVTELVATQVNFNDAVTIVINVTDTSKGLTYDVTYTAGLTELQ